MNSRTYSANQTHRMRVLQGSELASFQRRAWAFLVDLVLGAVLFMALVIVVVHVAGDTPGLKITTPEDRQVDASDGTMLQLSFFANWYSIAWWVAYFGLTAFWGNGRTPGKRLLNIRAVSLVHDRLSLWHSLERALGYGASALEFGFGFVQYFIHPNRRTVHDRIAETIVVVEGAKRPTPAAAPGAMGLAEEALLQPLLDSWDRNNRICVNLLRALPSGALDVKTSQAGHTVAELFTHIHYVRLAFVAENAPECALAVPDREWLHEFDSDRLSRQLHESAQAVREAVTSRMEAGRALDQHYDHPLLFLQHMIWHEGYHHGQIKLALKNAGRPLSDEAAGPGSWGVWMRKSNAPS